MIEYRDATPADAEPLDAMAQAIWIETFSHGSAEEDWRAYVAEAYGPRGKLIAALRDGSARFHLAVADGRIIGYVKINAPWLPDAEAGAMQLSQLYVASDWHGRGVAQALMGWAVGEARAAHAPALLLTVWERNDRARRFYEKLGFVHVGDYAFPVGKQIDTDNIMRLALAE